MNRNCNFKSKFLLIVPLAMSIGCGLNLGGGAKPSGPAPTESTSITNCREIKDDRNACAKKAQQCEFLSKAGETAGLCVARKREKKCENLDQEVCELQGYAETPCQWLTSCAAVADSTKEESGKPKPLDEGEKQKQTTEEKERQQLEQEPTKMKAEQERKKRERADEERTDAELKRRRLEQEEQQRMEVEEARKKREREDRETLEAELKRQRLEREAQAKALEEQERQKQQLEAQAAQERLKKEREEKEANEIERKRQKRELEERVKALEAQERQRREREERELQVAQEQQRQEQEAREKAQAQKRADEERAKILEAQRLKQEQDEKLRASQETTAVTSTTSSEAIARNQKKFLDTATEAARSSDQSFEGKAITALIDAGAALLASTQIEPYRGRPGAKDALQKSIGEDGIMLSGYNGVWRKRFEQYGAELGINANDYFDWVASYVSVQHAKKTGTWLGVKYKGAGAPTPNYKELFFEAFSKLAESLGKPLPTTKY